MALTIPAFGLGTGQAGPTQLFDPRGESRELERAQYVEARAAQERADAITRLGMTGQSLAVENYAFMKRLSEQEALGYLIDKRNQVLPLGTKLVNEWAPTVTGPNALEAPKALQEKLTGLKDELLKDAPSDMAREKASRDLDSHIASFMTQGENIAQKGFKSYNLNALKTWEGQLAGIVANSGGNAEIQQWALDTGKASWIATGQNGLIISPEEAQNGINAFEKRIAKASLDGQLADPRFQNKAMVEIKSGIYNDVLGEDAPGYVHKAEIVRSHLIAEAKRAQHEAKANLHERQNLNMYETLKLARDDPKGFASQVSLPVIDQMVYSGRISPGQGQQLVDLKTGADRHSDPVVRDEAYRLAAIGGLTNEWIAENGGNLSGPDLFTVTGRLQTQVDKSVEGKTAKLFIDDMFRDERMVAQVRGQGGEELQNIHEAIIAAQDFATTRLKEGAALPLVKAEVTLKYDPDIGDNAPPPKSKYLTAVPDSPESIKPYFERLWMVDSKNMKKDAVNREWSQLYSAYQRAEKRQQLKQQIQSMGGK